MLSGIAVVYVPSEDVGCIQLSELLVAALDILLELLLLFPTFFHSYCCISYLFVILPYFLFLFSTFLYFDLILNVEWEGEDVHMKVNTTYKYHPQDYHQFNVLSSNSNNSSCTTSSLITNDNKGLVMGVLTILILFFESTS